MVGDLRSCEISAITTVAHCRTVRARRSRADRLAPPPTFDTPFSRAAGVRYRRRFRRLLNVFIVHVTTRRRNRGCTTARTVLARWLHRQKSSLTPATTLAMVRVVIAEDSFVVRQGLVALLGTEADIEVVATAETFDEALAAALRHRPDVVLTDIRMPPTGTDEGIRLAATLRLHAPEIGVVVLSQHADPAYALELLAAGSERRSYLLKERIGDADPLLQRAADRGRRWIVSRSFDRRCAPIGSVGPANHRARPPHTARARHPRRAGNRQIERRDRRSALPFRTLR